MARRTAGGDPHWTKAYYPGECSGCKAPIEKGSRIFYYPLGRKVYGSACPCGDEHARDFASHRFDEDGY